MYEYYKSFSPFWSLFKTYNLENWTEMFHPFKRNTFRTLLKFIVKKQEVCKLLFQQFFEQVKAVEAHLRLSTKKSYSVFDLWLWPLMGNDLVSSFRVYKGGRGSSIKEWKQLQTRFNFGVKIFLSNSYKSLGLSVFKLTGILTEWFSIRTK